MQKTASETRVRVIVVETNNNNNNLWTLVLGRGFRQSFSVWIRAVFSPGSDYREQQDFLPAATGGLPGAVSRHHRAGSSALTLILTALHLPSDGEGAGSRGGQGALGGAGQPREGQVCRHPNGTWGGSEARNKTGFKVEVSAWSCPRLVLSSVWGHHTHTHRIPRPLQRPFPARLQRASVQGSSVSKTVSDT